MPPGYSALLDANTSVLLMLSVNVPVMVFLQECIPDSVTIHNVNYLNYTTSFPLAAADPATYPTWRWDNASRTFEHAQKDITGHLAARSILAKAKHDAIQEMIRRLTVARYPLWSGLLLQETVYSRKREEAKRFRDSDGTEAHAADYPFLVTYADGAGITMKQAADDILFQANLADDLLAKTELVRLKYFELVKQAADPAATAKILEAFVRETSGVAIK